MLVYGDSGMSVMEMSHRSKAFESIIQSAEESLRRVMGIPENYKVLFLQGGASSQFAMIPLNLMKKGKIDLVLTGMWSKKARAEAEKYGKVNVVASSEDKTFNYIPELDSSKFDQTAFSVAGSMKEVDIIVTDKEPTERWKKHFEKFNVKCLYPV